VFGLSFENLDLVRKIGNTEAQSCIKIRTGEVMYRYPNNWTGPSLKGQSHEKVGEMSVWGISLGPN
jgi:hypothetical protein